MKRMKDVIKETCYSPEEEELFGAVMRQIGASWSDVWGTPMDYRDASTGVGGFCYYSETEAFAKRNIQEILYCLNGLEEDLGEPLKKDNNNLMNWYAWFALEYIIDKVVTYKEQEDD